MRPSNSFAPEEVEAQIQIMRKVMVHPDFAVLRRAPGVPGLARKFLAMQKRIETDVKSELKDTVPSVERAEAAE